MGGRRVAYVDTDTWLFPQHTLDALALYLARDEINDAALAALVTEAVAGRDIQMRNTGTAIQYRNGILDTWKTVITVEFLKGPQGVQGVQGIQGIPGPSGADGTDAVLAHIVDPEPHPAYDDISSLKLIFENKLV